MTVWRIFVGGIEVGVGVLGGREGFLLIIY